MRYVVYGAGAVGGVIGARLHLAEMETTLIARGEHLAAIRADGLVLDDADGGRVITAPAHESAAGVTWSADTVVLLCVKGHQTPAALADLVAHAPPKTAVVSAQNGVSNETQVLRHFAHTYALCVMLPALHLEPGTVVQKCHPVPGILDLGCFPSGIDATAEAIAADLRAAGFESVPRRDIMAWKHRKLLVNAVGDVSALFTDTEASAELRRRVAAEGEAVLIASGTPFVSQAQDDERRGEVLQPRGDIADFPGNSLWQSLSRGRPSEADYRNGEIVLLGRLSGVPTPANELIRRAALDAAGAPGPVVKVDATEALASLTS